MTELLEEKLSDLQLREIKRIVEAVLFSSADPLPFKKLRSIVETYVEIEAKQLRTLIDELAQEFREQGKAYKLEEIAHGFILRTYPQYNTYIAQVQPTRGKDKLSQAALEVLAIVAYRGPLTRAEIESIRGVDCSGMVHNLLERELIEVTGKLEVPGRPSQYGVTKSFLVHFGLKDVQELKSCQK